MLFNEVKGCGALKRAGREIEPGLSLSVSKLPPHLFRRSLQQIKCLAHMHASWTLKLQNKLTEKKEGK